MIGCNSTDDELEQREIDYARAREDRLKELELENHSLRDEIRTLEAEKLNLEVQVGRLEDEIERLEIQLDEARYESSYTSGDRW